MQMKRKSKKTRRKTKRRAAKRADKDLWLDIDNSNNHVAESRAPLRKCWPQCPGTQDSAQPRCRRPAEAQSATTLAAEPTATETATGAATQATAASAAVTIAQLQEGSNDQYFPFEGIEQLCSAMQMWTSARVDLMDFLAELIDNPSRPDTDAAYEVMIQRYKSSPLYSHAEQRLWLLLSAQGASPDEAQLKVEEVFDELYSRVCEAIVEAAAMD